MTLTTKQLAEIDQRVQKIIESAPPLGPIQRDRIASAMHPVRRRIAA